jgi:subtilase family serine protease
MDMLLNNRKLSRFLLYVAGILIIFMYISPCLATYNFEGVPEQDELIETTSGTVKGGLYVDGGEGLKETPYVQEFNVPGDSVKWARIYVGVWGGTEDKKGTLDLTVNGKDFESVDLEGKADNGDDEGQNPSIYCTGHGVYWVAYDVGTNISTGPVKVEAKTEGGIDGRVYGIVLAAVYEDKDGEDTKYWIEEGNLNLHGKGWSGDMPSTHDEGYADFSGKIDADKYKTANLAVVYLCGSPGLEDSLYFNDEQLSDGDNKNDIANSKSYFDLKFFDVLDFLTEDDNEVKFQRDDEDYVHPVLAALTLGTGEAGSSSDLIVSGLTLPVICAGKDNVIKANIKNIGKDSASSFQAALYADDEIVSTASVSSLASDKNKTIEFNWKPASDGQKALKVYVDYANKIKETSEVNNFNAPVLAKIVDMTPPEIEIESPEDGGFVDAGEITVSGTVEDTSRNLTVDVNGRKAMLSDGSWSAKVPMVSGSNIISVSAIDKANNTAKELIVVNKKASFLRDFNESSRSKNQSKTISANETLHISWYKDLLQNKIYLFFKNLISNWWRRF